MTAFTIAAVGDAAMLHRPGSDLFRALAEAEDAREERQHFGEIVISTD